MNLVEFIMEVEEKYKDQRLEDGFGNVYHIGMLVIQNNEVKQPEEIEEGSSATVIVDGLIYFKIGRTIEIGEGNKFWVRSTEINRRKSKTRMAVTRL